MRSIVSKYNTAITDIPIPMGLVVSGGMLELDKTVGNLLFTEDVQEKKTDVSDPDRIKMTVYICETQICQTCSGKTSSVRTGLYKVSSMTSLLLKKWHH